MMIVASGDDSEILSVNKLRVNNKRFADVFNYEVKTYDTMRSIYFCSKFMIIDEGVVYMVPDLLKIVKKLGRHDMKNREHVVSYRRSVLDTLKDFIVPESVKLEYVSSISERHKFVFDSIDSVLASLFELSLHDEKFEALYIPNDNYHAGWYGSVAEI